MEYEFVTSTRNEDFRCAWSELIEPTSSPKEQNAVLPRKSGEAAQSDRRSNFEPKVPDNDFHIQSCGSWISAGLRGLLYRDVVTIG